MMTAERDAQFKWCPFAHLSEMGGTHNRSGPSANFNCIASACMAWRGVETREFRLVADEKFRKTGERLVSDVGYCGLAGAPQHNRAGQE